MGSLRTHHCLLFREESEQLPKPPGQLETLRNSGNIFGFSREWLEKMSPAGLVQEISDHFAFGYLSAVYQTMVSESVCGYERHHFLHVLVKPRNCIMQGE